MGEIGIRVYSSRHLLYDIEMSRYALELKERSENPGIGHVHRPNKTAHLMGVDIRINSDGFRDQEYPVARTGKRRMIFLGDSIALGWGVPEGATFADLLERDLSLVQPIEIINFGIGNYNTEQEVELFLQRGLKYAPDQVVVFYFINDAEPTPARKRFEFLAHSRLIAFYWSRLRILMGPMLPEGNYRIYYSSLYRENSPGLHRMEAAFLKLKDVCQQHHIKLQVVLIPELHNLKDYPFRKEHAWVENFLKGHQIDVLDLAPSFSTQSHPQELWIARDDAHPNQKAHSMIARSVYDFIGRF